MSDDAPLYNASTIVVAADDGMLFSCTPYEMGGVNLPRQIRWQLIDANGVTYIGPAYDRQTSTLEELHRVVSEWWEMKKALGQAGKNLQWLRDHLAE